MTRWAALRLLIAAELLAPIYTAAQETDTQAATRAGQIEEARRRKAEQLTPDETSSVERALVTIKDKRILERITAGIAGFRLKFGGLATGSGMAFGPEYLRRDLADGELTLRSSARVSTRGWQMYDLQLAAPNLKDNRYYAEFYAVHRNLAGINYYGPGPDSDKTGRSNFRLEDTDITGAAGVHPIRHMNLGITGGLLNVNVGRGTDERFASAGDLYSPDVTPGIDRQSDFLHGGLLVQYDNRDNPGGPRRGGNYFATLDYYSDRKFDAYSFRRLHLEAQQYVPFFNERRVFAFRAKSVTTYMSSGQRVPFYLQPVVGGSDDLRGFRPFRFYGDNAIVMNAEYRWETFSGLDMAVFADAGKVFDRRSQWNLHDLESSVGFGLRFNVRNDVFMRVDIGFSHEGYQVWLKFNNVF